MEIQKNFNYLKALHRYSYRDISKETSINLNTLTTISNGSSKNVTIITLVKLSKFFKVSLDDFVLQDISKYKQEQTEKGD